MTRFEEASLNPMNMSIMVAFCIAAYLEQSDIRTFTDDELKEFMSEISTDIEEWLRDEVDCHSCKTEHDCYECEKYEESEGDEWSESNIEDIQDVIYADYIPIIKADKTESEASDDR